MPYYTPESHFVRIGVPTHDDIDSKKSHVLGLFAKPIIGLRSALSLNSILMFNFIFAADIIQRY